MVAEGVHHSGHRSEQAEDRREVGDRGQDAEEAFEFRDFKLARLLHDFAQLRARRVVANDGRMNDPCDWPGRARGLMECFGKIPPRDEIGEPLKKLADMNRRAMEIEQPLREDSDRNDAADQNGPHQQSTLLDVIDHPEPS